MSRKIEIGADKRVAAFILIFFIALFSFLWVKTQTYTSPQAFEWRVSHPTESTGKWERIIENGRKEGRKYLLLYSSDEEFKTVKAKLLVTAKNGSYISEKKLSPNDVSEIMKTKETDVAEDEYSYDEIVSQALKKGHGRLSIIKTISQFING